MLVALVREARRRVATSAPRGAESGRSLLTEEDFAQDLDILEGRSVHAPGRRSSGPPAATTPDDLAAFVREHVAPELVEVLCLLPDLGVNPEANLGRAVLVPYLYQHSGWLREALTFERTITGGALEFAIGESSEWVTTENVRKFLDELAAIPRPTSAGELQTQFDHLRELLRYALEDRGSPLC